MCFRMLKKEFFVILLASIIALGGLAIEMIWGSCTSAFSRSGALIVGIGIIFGIRFLKNAYEKNFEEKRENLEHDRPERDIVFNKPDLENEIKGSTNYFISEATSTLKSDLKRVGLIDTLILASGTLIWGFGDLVVKLPC